jgi:hypothetical protein
VLTITAVYENGIFRPTGPVDLPEGTEVTVLPHGPSAALGISDEQWPTDPEAIRQLAVRMNQVEPFEMTPAEEADLAAWRKQVKDYTLAHQDKAIEGLFE